MACVGWEVAEGDPGETGVVTWPGRRPSRPLQNLQHPPHPRPPKLALNESERAVVTWVAGESGGMAPLEYLSPGLPRDKLSPVWTSTGGRLGTSSFPNLLLDIHPSGIHEHLRSQNRLWCLSPVLRVEHPPESIGLNILRARPTEPAANSTSWQSGGTRGSCGLSRPRTEP